MANESPPDDDATGASIGPGIGASIGGIGPNTDANIGEDEVAAVFPLAGAMAPLLGSAVAVMVGLIGGMALGVAELGPVPAALATILLGVATPFAIAGVPRLRRSLRLPRRRARPRVLPRAGTLGGTLTPTAVPSHSQYTAAA